MGSLVNGQWRYKSHLVFTWINELKLRPEVLYPVEDLLGLDILMWSSQLYLKKPGDGRFICWH